MSTVLLLPEHIYDIIITDKKLKKSITYRPAVKTLFSNKKAGFYDSCDSFLSEEDLKKNYITIGFQVYVKPNVYIRTKYSSYTKIFDTYDDACEFARYVRTSDDVVEFNY